MSLSKEGNPLGSGYGSLKILKKGTRWGAVTGYENVKEGNPLGSGYGAVKINIYEGENIKG